MDERYRVLARIPEGQGESPEVVMVKTVTNKVMYCHDPDIDWYKDNVPCRRTCPAGTRIPEYISAAAGGDYYKCYEINRVDNVLPHILGRVCAHPCEDDCRHGYDGMGSPVSICWLKRSGADHKESAPELKTAYPTGKKVAVIGSGPAGLALAQDFSLWGHSVTIFEAMEKPGGMMRYGIPRFRLPEDIIDYEIGQILNLGAQLKCGVKVGEDPLLNDLARDFDAVVMAGGCALPTTLDIPGIDAEGVVYGLDFMNMVNTGALKKVTGHVVVLGGGFTAMDCSRSAYRLGAEEVTVVYRRTRNELKVDERELRETSVEGISFRYLLSPHEVKTNGGRITEALFQRNSLGPPGSDGRRSIKPMEGKFETIKADWLIPAISQFADMSPFGGKITVNTDDYKTPMNKIFATGDYVTGPQDIITAIGHAHNTARKLDKFLMGHDRFVENVHRQVWGNTVFDSYQGWKSVEGNIYDLIPRLDMPAIELSQRRDQMKEADTGYDKNQTYWQGQRCYLCNHNIQIDGSACILCYNCVDVCPYGCIIMAGEKWVRVYKNGSPEPEGENFTYMIIEEKNCVRCGLCIDVCPVPCITMEKLEIETLHNG
ncbi:MAG: NADPH-dependent glutamate synthase small subunit [bacterium]|nr:MAG: NADPH-dependent glutamate synthase small subunit [bacterium]